MWRRALSLVAQRRFSSEPGIPTLYSFLQPSIFALSRTSQPSSDPPKSQYQTTPKTLTQDHQATLESTLLTSLNYNNTDEAWKSFKTLTNSSSFPSKPLTNSLITHLCSLTDTHNLKRAFASAVFLLEKNPQLLEHETVGTLLNSMKDANTGTPAFALVKSMFKNRFFMPFSLWGNLLVEISRKSGSFVAFLRIFHESCRIAKEEKLDFMKPDLSACNAALEGCCRELESVSDAEKVVETMSVLRVRPDESSFCFLAYLYALKGLEGKITALEGLMTGFGFSDNRMFLCNLISGYVKSGNLELVLATILRSLRERDGHGSNFSEETYIEVVKGFLQNGSIKELSNLIIATQKLETPTIMVDKSIGHGIINACVNLGLLDKAHSILDEMNAQGGSVGLGVYVSILKAYCKEQRTAEATQLVTEISNSGLQLDAGTYDALIEASMSSQDFQSAFSLFRDMRETRIPDLKGSYLTIMTGLTEKHRPELMAAFLDEVVEDPRVGVSTHDWNSIIHAFCKAGRLEDARRTFRRMIFLRFEPNEQTYLSLINGYMTAEKYFSILMLWNEVKRKVSIEGGKRFKLDHSLADAFLYALVKGGFFDAVMQVVEKSQEMKIFVDKWRCKQAFMEKHKKLKVSKLRNRNFRKMEALIAFKNWAGEASVQNTAQWLPRLKVEMRKIIFKYWNSYSFVGMLSFVFAPEPHKMDSEEMRLREEKEVMVLKNWNNVVTSTIDSLFSDHKHHSGNRFSFGVVEIFCKTWESELPGSNHVVHLLCVDQFDTDAVGAYCYIPAVFMGTTVTFIFRHHPLYRFRLSRKSLIGRTCQWVRHQARSQFSAVGGKLATGKY
ncbi:unnamed protein product [Ilex paraguariensis]|uniref:At1g68980-like TPR repeats domain-containing protein n=1 Tax=Ilex paraguariensis TaxID=185542 RepID=A0ABC8T990_9AQUA